MSPERDWGALVAAFGVEVAAKFRTGAGEPEDHLRSPIEKLFSQLGGRTPAARVVLAGEERLGEIRARPDFAVEVGGALIGYIEVKAPGKGADPERYREARDRQQWARLRSLPNVLYTDGEEWALYRFGERAGDLVRLDGDVRTAGRDLGVTGPGLRLVLTDFLSWAPTPPRSPHPRQATHQSAEPVAVVGPIVATGVPHRALSNVAGERPHGDVDRARARSRSLPRLLQWASVPAVA